MAYNGIRIETQPARLGITSNRTQITIKQPKATFELKAVPPRVEIVQPRGELTIDQSRAWDALSVGSNLDLMSRIYSESWELGLEGIARIVDESKRFEAIHLGGNPIAEIAHEQAFRELPISIPTYASNMNVDLNYRARPAEISAVRGRVDANIRKNAPEIDHIKGNIHFQMLQYQSIKITPPQLDIRV